jgi:GTP-binding protein
MLFCAKMFVDKVKIHAKAGDGGNGCVSFRREKYVERGGPDGGNGGNGGSIVLVADKNVQDLTDLYYAPLLRAKRGEHGRGKNQHGATAPDVVVKVPCGTLVKKLPENEVIADLVEHGQRFVLARGGRGGRGNTAFKSSTHQAPREFEYGKAGEELDAELELKTVADVGIVGYPNAGKSTLLSKISRAHPKIAAYPFTTLSPNVGTMNLDEFGGERLTVADVPGLIAGAHAGKGLGHDFLRHIERCKALIILLDMAGVDGRDPRDDYQQLLEELKLYNPVILKKPRIVAANKMDLPQARKNLQEFRRKNRVRAIEISAKTGDGLEKLKLALRKLLT